MIHTATALASAFAARYPNQPGGDIASLQAAGSTIDSIQAGAIKGFAQVSGKLIWVRATENFFVSGEPVSIGDFVQVEDFDAKFLISAGRAVSATDAEVSAAASSGKTESSAGGKAK